MGTLHPGVPTVAIWAGRRLAADSGGHAPASGHVSPPEWLPPPYRLQEVAVSLVENAVCDQQYHDATRYRLAGRKIIQDDMLCAGTEGRDSCQVSPSPSGPPPRAGGQPGLSAVSSSSGRLRRPSGVQDNGCLALGGSGQLGQELCGEKPSRGLRSRPDVRALDHAANREGPLTRACWPSARLGPEERTFLPPEPAASASAPPSLAWAPPSLLASSVSGTSLTAGGRSNKMPGGRAGSPWGPGCLAVLSN